MTVNAIMDLARNWTHTTAAQCPNATLIDWVNIRYRELLRKVTTEINENYFVTTATVDAVSSSASYALASDFLKLKEVRFKWNAADTVFTKSTEADFSKLPYSVDYYKLYQPIGEPLHQVIGNNLVIAPQFLSTNVLTVDNNQIEYDYEARQVALAVAGSEATVLLPVDYHYVIANGIKQDVLCFVGRMNEKIDAVNDYRMATQEMLANMTDRDVTQNVLSMPSTVNLE
jgi:hypothetical protein